MWVWYGDDVVWHERILLWRIGPASARSWIILTPDYDAYEDILMAGDDIHEVRATKRALRHPCYTFQAGFTDGMLLARILEAEVSATELAAAEGSLLPERPSQYVRVNGRVASLPPRAGSRRGCITA